jgi:hypothetical protein
VGEMKCSKCQRTVTKTSLTDPWGRYRVEWNCERCGPVEPIEDKTATANPKMPVTFVSQPPEPVWWENGRRRRRRGLMQSDVRGATRKPKAPAKARTVIIWPRDSYSRGGG